MKNIFKKLIKYNFIFLFLTLSTLGFAQQPKLMLPIGHTSTVDFAVFSPDGKKISTTSYDHTVKIWEAATGYLLVKIDVNCGEMGVEIFFSQNGKQIITIDYEKYKAKIWDSTSGKLILSFEDTNAVFSPNSKEILTYYNEYNTMLTFSSDSEDKAAVFPPAKILDTETKELKAELKGHTGNIHYASYSSAGTKIVTASNDVYYDFQSDSKMYKDETTKIWDAENGSLLVNLEGYTENVKSAIFSPDGTKILTQSYDSKTAKIWDAENGSLLVNIEGYTENAKPAIFSPDGTKILTQSYDSKTTQIWDAESGNLIVNLKGHTDKVRSAEFSPDGKKIVTASNDETAKIWDAESGKIISNFEGHTGRVNYAVFSPDGKKIVTVSNDETAKIWDANTGKLLIDLKGHTEAFRDVEISPDGQHFLTRSENGKTKIWNIITGKLIAALNSHLDYFAFYATFSLDGTKVLMACSDHTAKILDSATGQLILNLTGHTAQVISAVFIDNGNKIITISLDNTLKIWDAENGNLLVNLKGHTDMINSFALSPDGTKVVTGSLDTTVKIWNANTGTLIYDLKGHTDEIQSVEYSPDGRSILTASWDSVKIWDSGTGKLIYNIEVNKEFGPHQMFDAAFFSLDGKQITIRYGYRTKIWDIASKKLFFDTDDIKDENQKGVEDTYTGIYSPNNKQIMTVNGDVRMWDAVSRKLIFKLEGHTGWVNSADFTKDGKMIITGSDDQTAKIWDATTGQLIYTLIAVDHSEYLVYDDKGHYDGTEAARNLLYFTCGSEVIGLDQVKDQLWVPNLAERIIKGDTINAKTLSELDICGLTPEVEEGHGSTGEYYFKITPRRGGLGDTVLLVNGIEVKRYQSSELKKNGDFYELILKNEKLSNYFVEGEENQITVKSYTSDNTISSRGANPFSTKTKAPTSPPNLYAVMVGVSDYKGTQLHLKYAAKDANDISRAVENASKKLLNTDKQEHVFMYNLTTEKDHYLLPEKNGIKKVLAEIGKKATPNDILLLFFAGHGVMEGDKKQFYFLTSDASGFTNVADVGISTAELTEWIKPQNIKAQKRILIFDACNSGQAIKDFVKMGTDDQKYLAARDDENSQQIKAIDKLNEKSGLFILSASASNKSAYEMGRYSQGLLTYSLLKAIKQDPEILEDGKYLNVSRWFNAAEKTVTELSKDNGARQEPQIITSNNINIGLVDDEVIAKIILPSEKPLFASSNFQNADENIADDDLEISKLINLQLNDLATRGSDSNIVYITSTNSPDAYSLSGRYSITGNEIVMTVNIKQKKVIRNKFEIKGAKDKLNELANAVVERASELVK